MAIYYISLDVPGHILTKVSYLQNNRWPERLRLKYPRTKCPPPVYAIYDHTAAVIGAVIIEYKLSVIIFPSCIPVLVYGQTSDGRMVVGMGFRLLVT